MQDFSQIPRRLCLEKFQLFPPHPSYSHTYPWISGWEQTVHLQPNEQQRVFLLRPDLHSRAQPVTAAWALPCVTAWWAHTATSQLITSPTQEPRWSSSAAQEKLPSAESLSSTKLPIKPIRPPYHRVFLPWAPRGCWRCWGSPCCSSPPLWQTLGY